MSDKLIGRYRPAFYLLSLLSTIALGIVPVCAQDQNVPIQGRTIYQDSSRYLNPGSSVLRDDTRNKFYILSVWPTSVGMKRINAVSEQIDHVVLEELESSQIFSSYLSSAISHDGRFLAYARLGQSGIHLVNLETMENQFFSITAPEVQFQTLNSSVDGLAFDFKGNLYFTLSESLDFAQGSRLYYLNVQNRTVNKTEVLLRWGSIKSTHGGTVLWGPVFSAAQSNADMARYDISGAVPVRLEMGLSNTNYLPDVSERGNRLVTVHHFLSSWGGLEQKLVVFNASSLQPIASGPATAPWIPSFALNPQGDSIYQPNALLNQPGDPSPARRGIVEYKLSTDAMNNPMLVGGKQFEAPNGTVTRVITSADGAKLMALVDSYDPTTWGGAANSTVSIVMYDTLVAPMCDLAAFKLQNDALRSENALLDSDRSDRTAERDAALAKVADLEADHAELQAALEAANAQVTQLQSENSTLKVKVGMLEASVLKLQGQIRTLTAYYSNVITQLQLQLTDCQRKVLLCPSPTPTPSSSALK